MNDGVSVVICCYNSASRITTVLEYLSNQEINHPIPWEVVLVDNASDDETTVAARRAWKSDIIPLHIVIEPKKGLSNARRKGIQESHYEFVSFIDDDNWVNTRWIEGVYSSMKNNPDVALVGGRGEAVFEKEEPEWFGRFQQSFAVGPQAAADGIMKDADSFLYGAGLVLRKSVWDKIIDRGFEFQLSGRTGKMIASGEDSEMCYAIKLAGYDLYYDSTLTFKHYMSEGRMSVPYLIRLAGSFGKASVITNMYISLLNNSQGLDRLKIQNYFLALLHALYNILLVLPDYFRNKKFKSKFIQSEYDLAFSIQNLKRKLQLFGRYRKYVHIIKNADWHNLHERIHIN